MAKRSHSEFAKDNSSDSPVISSKRLKVPDALSLLSDHSEDLIQCLQLLKRQKSSSPSVGSDPTLVQRLTTLSRDLLPAFQTLGDRKSQNDAEAGSRNGSEPAERTDGSKPAPQREVTLLTQWTPREVTEKFPDLPKVLDPVIEEAAFTHAGMVSKDDLSYERLEWLGDAYLYLISTGFIYQTFRELPPGRCCHLREVLVRNATLKDYSVHYGFPQRAKFPKEFGLHGRENGTTASKEQRVKVLGDIFEAYVAAVIVSDPVSGVARVSKWLKALWSMTISHEILKEWKKNNQPGLMVPDMGPSTEQQSPAGSRTYESPKVQLAAELAYRSEVKIEYKTLDQDKPQKKDPLTKMPLFKQGCFLLGYGETVQLGVGTALRKVEADKNAAQMALNNKKLIKTYKEKKRILVESRKAQAEAAKQLEGSLF